MSDEIKQELLKREIKLWKPPYYGVRGSQRALQDLASTFAQEDALHELQNYRTKALTKLKEKGKILQTLTILILGGGGGGTTTTTAQGDGSVDDSCLPETWAESVVYDQKKMNIKLSQVNPDLMVSELANDLRKLLQVTNLPRLLHKNSTLELSDVPISSLVTVPKATLLCLVSEEDQQQSDMQQENPDEALIKSIRTAAGQNSSSMTLDVTDSAGNLVSMTHQERLSFMTALGLHAIASKKMKEGNLQSALIFLLQADEEWNQLGETWRTRVDNFGLLQLDVCWVYLKLESLENLPNVLERLKTAETVLRKQVHSNFVTLALVQAEMDNPVPALAAMFVRLFLLQGVAQHYQNQASDSSSSSKSNDNDERLDWAWALAKSLRSVAPPDAVGRLLEAVDTTPYQAISSLRRSNGNLDRAAELIEQEKSDTEKAADDRYKQREIGLCQNGSDFVDLRLLEQLQTVLGLPASDGERVASGLLRLSNNNVDGALDIFQDCLRDVGALMGRVSDLDRSQGVVPRKRSRADDAVAVDEMALASLVSMGVGDAKARQALQSSKNNIENALLWLTNDSNSPATPTARTAAHDETSTETTEQITPSNGTENEQGISAATVTAAGATTPPVESRSFSRPSVVTPHYAAEREAVELLQRIMGDVLDGGGGDGAECSYLGNDLDEEWAYIDKYRKAGP